MTSGSHGRDFLELVVDCFLVQHVLFPTRGDNCLDLILSSDENSVSNVGNRGKVSTSDHDLIAFDIKFFNERLTPGAIIPPQ